MVVSCCPYYHVSHFCHDKELGVSPDLLADKELYLAAFCYLVGYCFVNLAQHERDVPFLLQTPREGT